MKINKLILALIVLLSFCGCQEKFEKHYDLSIDANAYTLPYSGDTFPLYVYCSGTWSATFDAEVDWVQIEPGTDHGQGNGIIRITFQDNDVAPRQVNVVIRSGEFTKTVNLSQRYNSTHLEVE